MKRKTGGWVSRWTVARATAVFGSRQGGVCKALNPNPCFHHLLLLLNHTDVGNGRKDLAERSSGQVGLHSSYAKPSFCKSWTPSNTKLETLSSP